MARAQGPGISIGGLALPAKYLRVFAQAEPYRDPTAPTQQGSYDALGNYLHVKYEANLDLGARSNGNQTSVNTTGLNPMPGMGGPIESQALDFVANKMVVEFDAVTQFTLPFEGTLYLVGGYGDYKWSLQVIDMVDARWYAPQARYLRRVYTPGGAVLPGFRIPSYHTLIMGTNPTDTVYIDPLPGTPTDLPGYATLTPGVNAPGAQIIPNTYVEIANPSTTSTTLLTGVSF